MISRRPAVLVAFAAALLAGCATTYDSTETTVTRPPDASTTTSTLPHGTTAELLAAMLHEASTLSATMIAGGDAGAQVARLQELWDAARADVGAKRPDLLADFLANVDRCQLAVRLRRAADADKAAKNLDQLIKAFGTGG